jgi:hypothetical protein
MFWFSLIGKEVLYITTLEEIQPGHRVYPIAQVFEAELF